MKKLYQDLIKSSLKRSGDTYDWKWQFVDDYVLCIWYHGRSTKFSLTVVKSLSATLFEKPHRNAIKKQTNKNTTEKSKREWSKRVNPPYMTLFPWKLFSIYSCSVSYCVVILRTPLYWSVRVVWCNLAGNSFHCRSRKASDMTCKLGITFADESKDFYVEKSGQSSCRRAKRSWLVEVRRRKRFRKLLIEVFGTSV